MLLKLFVEDAAQYSGLMPLKRHSPNFAREAPSFRAGRKAPLNLHLRDRCPYQCHQTLPREPSSTEYPSGRNAAFGEGTGCGPDEPRISSDRANRGLTQKSPSFRWGKTLTVRTLEIVDRQRWYPYRSDRCDVPSVVASCSRAAGRHFKSVR